MTTDNEALKLANSVPELQSLLYDVDLMPEQLDPTGFGYRRMLAIVEAYKVGIQTGRDQMQKELAEVQVVGYISVITGAHGGIIKHLSKNKVRENDTPLIPQPTMPKKGERRERKMVD